MRASDGEIEKSIESCERWEWFGGGLVVVGVIAELALAAWHPPYDSFLEQWGSSLANGLVATGVAFEIKFGQMAGLRQGELRRRSDENVAAATIRAAEANRRAEEAALELAKFRAVRSLREEQWDRVFQRLKPLGSRSFDIAVQFADPEADRCANGFWFAFSRSGWTQIDWFGGISQHGLPARGHVNISGLIVTKDLHNDDPEAMKAVRALAEALTEEGLSAEVQYGIVGIAEIAGNRDTIHILIGQKQ